MKGDVTSLVTVVRDVASDYGRTVTDDEAGFILWEYTGFPSFYPTGQPVDDTIVQVDRYFSLNRHGWVPCIQCGRPALATDPCCEPCDRELTLAEAHSAHPGTGS